MIFMIFVVGLARRPRPFVQNIDFVILHFVFVFLQSTNDPKGRRLCVYIGGGPERYRRHKYV